MLFHNLGPAIENLRSNWDLKCWFLRKGEIRSSHGENSLRVRKTCKNKLNPHVVSLSWDLNLQGHTGNQRVFSPLHLLYSKTLMKAALSRPVVRRPQVQVSAPAACWNFVLGSPEFKSSATLAKQPTAYGLPTTSWDF